MMRVIPLSIIALVSLAAQAEVRVQDVARLQGQRTNPLMGYGLVVGLGGTGDGGKSAVTARALMAMHQRFSQELIGPEELRNVSSVALVAVEASIPEFGARDGQALDVRVSTVGEAKSLKGGRLLPTPLQYALFDPDRPETQRVFAIAGGSVELNEVGVLTSGLIRGGAVLEADFYYSFIDDGGFTLVLSDQSAGYPMAQAVARAINFELARPAQQAAAAAQNQARRETNVELASATGPKFVRVQIPQYEQARPAAFVARVMQTPIFALPDQQARVLIHRGSNQVTVSGEVVVSPTVLFVPGLGSVTIGEPLAEDETAPPAGQDAASKPAQPPTRPVKLDELLQRMNEVAVPPEQIVKSIEHLHRSGALHAQLLYRE